ncbi:hypothetical protein L7F22_060283 [Adiantum nelumboides]|nr:hypothetical protein [Adiantum nelumboides]
MGVTAFALGYVLVSLLVLFNRSAASLLLSDVCPKLDIEELLLLQENQCIVDGDGNPLYLDIAPGVAEVNGTTLERVLNILQTKQDAYAAILFYANWCPFSRTLRPLFETLASTFPGIYHIAVEDTAIQPRKMAHPDFVWIIGLSTRCRRGVDFSWLISSTLWSISLRLKVFSKIGLKSGYSALSQHGVHSFPVLFLYNKAVKVRYHGPRTLDAVGEFYKDITGSKTVSHHKRGSNGIAFIEKLSKKATVQGRVNCPYPWAKSPEKWLREDMYLMLSTGFLVLRVLVHLIPRLFSSLRYYWGQRESSLVGHRVLLRRVLLREQKTLIKSPVKGAFECERLRKGKTVLSVSGWSSSPLAAVTLAETSSSRSGGVEDARENGHGFGSHFWG